MYKKLFILLVFFLTISSNGQNIVLLKNFNPKASDLKHNLNKTRDSLVLSSDQNILKVDIFNEDFEKIVIVQNSKVNIPLQNIPVGEFVVEATLEDKVIIMELIRYAIDKNTSLSVDNSNTNEIGYKKITLLDENLKTVNISTKHNIQNILSPKKEKKSSKKNKFFWVVYIVYNQLGSSKTMKLVDQTVAKKMINKNKLELNSTNGKRNELRVWEVYDSSKFMKAQLADQNYINSTSSELFNVIPYYYSSENLIASN